MKSKAEIEMDAFEKEFYKLCESFPSNCTARVLLQGEIDPYGAYGLGHSEKVELYKDEILSRVKNQ